MRPLPRLAAFALLLALGGSLAACSLFENSTTGPPDLTWTGGTPPPRTLPPTITSIDTTTAARPVPPRRRPAEPPADEPVADLPEDQPADRPPARRPIRFPEPDPEPAQVPASRPAPPPSDRDDQPASDVLPAEPSTPATPEPDDRADAERPADPPVPDAAEPTVTVRPPAPPPRDAVPAEPAGRALALTEIDRQDRSDLALPPTLSGANKPDGLSLRYRRYVPPTLPSYVPVERDGLALFVADETPSGWLAFYKGRCGGLGSVCGYRAALYERSETPTWDLDLNAFLEQDQFVEIQDIRLHNGALYFNEACATYSDELDGACSQLVRVDPVSGREVWRTPALTSNNVFIFRDPYVIAGYGFTAEPDALFLVDQATGTVAQRIDLDSAHEYLEVQDDVLYVVTYRSLYAFRLD